MHEEPFDSNVVLKNLSASTTNLYSITLNMKVKSFVLPTLSSILTILHDL